MTDSWIYFGKNAVQCAHRIAESNCSFGACYHLNLRWPVNGIRRTRVMNLWYVFNFGEEFRGWAGKYSTYSYLYVAPALDRFGSAILLQCRDSVCCCIDLKSKILGGSNIWVACFAGSFTGSSQTVQTVKITVLMQHTPPAWQERSNCQLQNLNKINEINQNKIIRMNQI